VTAVLLRPVEPPPTRASRAGRRTSRPQRTLAAILHDAINDAGVDDYCLAGFSLGGAIAVRIALDCPDEVRALVGVVPWNAAGTTAGDEVIAGFDAAYGDAEALAQAVAAISLDPSKTSGLTSSMLTVTEQMWHGWLAGGALTSQADELSEIRVPSCYILGGKDVVVDQAKQLDDVRRIPGSRAVLLSDLGRRPGTRRDSRDLWPSGSG
jgi:pimeloyl-ACP methyl ester carboxylesterase